MSNKIFLIKYGQGLDGGFGDYCPPDWACAQSVNDADGNPLWFDNAEDAEAFARRCSKYAEEKFYEVGTHDMYDGKYPVEYEVFSFSIPTTAAVEDSDAEFSRLAPIIAKDAKDAAVDMFDIVDDDD